MRFASRGGLAVFLSAYETIERVTPLLVVGLGNPGPKYADTISASMWQMNSQESS